MSLKLNLGSGRMQLAGWTAVDIDPELYPDVVAEVEHLPFEDDSIEEIYASHILEHVPYDSPALKEWLRVLQPGGIATVIVPDLIQVYYLWKHGQRWGPYDLPVDVEYINASAFGAHIMQDKMPELQIGTLGHTHKQVFLFDMLVQALLDAGYVDVTEVVSCSVRRVSWGETMVRGIKPKD